MYLNITSDNTLELVWDTIKTLLNKLMFIGDEIVDSILFVNYACIDKLLGMQAQLWKVYSIITMLKLAASKNSH